MRLSRFALQLHVIFQTHPLDHIKLRFEEIDMLFFIREDFCKQIAADKVISRLAVGNRGTQVRNGNVLERQIAAQNFFYVLANFQAPEVLQIGQTLKK